VTGHKIATIDVCRGILRDRFNGRRLMPCKVEMDAGGGAVLRSVVSAGRVDSLPDV
jgi:hypothetical protein